MEPDYDFGAQAQQEDQYLGRQRALEQEAYDPVTPHPIPVERIPTGQSPEPQLAQQTASHYAQQGMEGSPPPPQQAPPRPPPSPLEDGPFTQADLLSMHKLQQGLAGAKTQVANGSITPELGAHYQKRIMQQLQPLLMRQQATNEQQEQQTHMRALKVAAMQAGVDNVNRKVRVQSIPELIATHTDAVTGATGHFTTDHKGDIKEIPFERHAANMDRMAQAAGGASVPGVDAFFLGGGAAIGNTGEEVPPVSPTEQMMLRSGMLADNEHPAGGQFGIGEPFSEGQDETPSPAVEPGQPGLQPDGSHIMRIYNGPTPTDYRFERQGEGWGSAQQVNAPAAPKPAEDDITQNPAAIQELHRRAEQSVTQLKGPFRDASHLAMANQQRQKQVELTFRSMLAGIQRSQEHRRTQDAASAEARTKAQERNDLQRQAHQDRLDRQKQAQQASKVAAHEHDVAAIAKIRERIVKERTLASPGGYANDPKGWNEGIEQRVREEWESNKRIHGEHPGHAEPAPTPSQPAPVSGPAPVLPPHEAANLTGLTNEQMIGAAGARVTKPEEAQRQQAPPKRSIWGPSLKDVFDLRSK